MGKKHHLTLYTSCRLSSGKQARMSRWSFGSCRQCVIWLSKGRHCDANAFFVMCIFKSMIVEVIIWCYLFVVACDYTCWPAFIMLHVCVAQWPWCCIGDIWCLSVSWNAVWQGPARSQYYLAAEFRAIIDSCQMYTYYDELREYILLNETTYYTWIWCYDDALLF